MVAILKRGKVIVVSVQGLFYSEERTEGLGEPWEGNSHHRAPVIGFKRALFDVRAHPVAVVPPPPPGGCQVSQHTLVPLSRPTKKKKISGCTSRRPPGRELKGHLKKERKKKLFVCYLTVLLLGHTEPTDKTYNKAPFRLGRGHTSRRSAAVY